MTTAMEWGAKPLPEQERLAVLFREVTSQVLSLENSSPVLDGLVATLEQARSDLAGLVPAGTHPRIGKAVDSDGRVFIDHCRDIGAYNPMFPVYELTVEGPGRAHGRVNFPIAYEGPAGCVNGGFLAVFFDEVVQHHNCDLGVSGATLDFDISYLRPTPLLTDLTFEIAREVGDSRILSEVRLLRSGEALCTARTNAVVFRGVARPAAGRRPR